MAFVLRECVTFWSKEVIQPSPQDKRGATTDGPAPKTLTVTVLDRREVLSTNAVAVYLAVAISYVVHQGHS